MAPPALKSRAGRCECARQSSDIVRRWFAFMGVRVRMWGSCGDNSVRGCVRGSRAHAGTSKPLLWEGRPTVRTSTRSPRPELPRDLSENPAECPRADSGGGSTVSPALNRRSSSQRRSPMAILPMMRRPDLLDLPHRRARRVHDQRPQHYKCDSLAREARLRTAPIRANSSARRTPTTRGRDSLG